MCIGYLSVLEFTIRVLSIEDPLVAQGSIRGPWEDSDEHGSPVLSRRCEWESSHGNWPSQGKVLSGRQKPELTDFQSLFTSICDILNPHLRYFMGLQKCPIARCLCVTSWLLWLSYNLCSKVCRLLVGHHHFAVTQSDLVSGQMQSALHNVWGSQQNENEGPFFLSKLLDFNMAAGEWASSEHGTAHTPTKPNPGVFITVCLA